MQDFLTSRKTPTSLDDIKSRLHLAREGPILRVQEVLRVSLLGDIFIYIYIYLFFLRHSKLPIQKSTDAERVN